MNKKRILIFSFEYFPYVGGAEIAIRELCKRMVDFDYTLITCRNDRQLPKKELVNGVQVVRVGWGIKKIDKKLFFLLAWARACILHWQERYDAVWGIMANRAGLAALLFKLIHPRIPYLLTLQEGDPPEYYFRRTWFWYPVYRLIYLRADYITVISAYLRQRALNYGYKGPLSIVPNGVDLKMFKRKEKKGNRIIITASRLVKKNNLENLVRAVALLNNVKLIIVGDGERRQAIENLIDELKIADIVKIVGYVEQEKLADYLNGADVFVRPSFSEGLGNSFLEAMAMGVPVVGTMTGGIPDFLINKETGVFCQPDQPESIAEAIKLILEDNRLRLNLIKNGVELVRERYNWDNLAIKMKNIFSQLTSQASKQAPDFIGLGAQRSGTSWIYACLYEHPQIYTPIKEIHFFSRNRNWFKGYSWYESLFKNVPDGVKAGEFSTSYLSDLDTPERIYKKYPNIKLIVSLRNPVDRAFSNYLNDIVAGVVKSKTSFTEALKNHPEYINGGKYATYLKNYLKFFSKDQILILIYEDSLKNPEGFIRRIYQFIGVKDDFKPSYLHKRVNEARVPRFVWVDRLFVGVADFLRRSGLYRIWWFIKKSGLPAKILKNINTRPVNKITVKLTDDEKKKLIGIFKKEVLELEDLLGYKINQWDELG